MNMQTKMDAKSLNMLSMLVSCIVICSSCLYGSAYAETDSPMSPVRSGQNGPPSAGVQSLRPRRTPPQAAIEACKGKTEGASCSISSPDGMLDGLCLTGEENIFACRPNRNRLQDKESRQEVNQDTPARQQDESGAALRNKSATLPKSEAPPIRRIEQIPSQKSSNSEPSSATEPQNPANQSPQILQAEKPLLVPLPQPKGFTENLGQNIWVLVSCLVIALLAAVLTWYALFRYSTLPLRRLRKVTQQLASGNLSARVGEGLVHRTGAVVDLGRDVDRMAERIESLVGAHQRLIRDVSHELRSPLARLNVALELARQSAGPTHAAPFDRIERESERLNELISQLLTLTKLESDNARIAREAVDLTALLAEIALDVDYEAKNCNRCVEITGSVPVKITGNKELLRQALENVIRNAIRYTAEGTAVELSLAIKKINIGVSAVLEVRDHGEGLPEGELTNIFRPFYRVSAGRERESGGTGVGLAISERAVRIHGGNIKAENAHDGGLTVRVELPLT